MIELYISVHWPNLKLLDCPDAVKTAQKNTVMTVMTVIYVLLIRINGYMTHSMPQKYEIIYTFAKVLVVI